MERRKKTLTRRYKMPHLFHDDLEEIERVLVEAKVEGYKFLSSEFEYKTVSEIQKSSGPFYEFEVSSYKPYISLNLYRGGAYLLVSEDDLRT